MSNISIIYTYAKEGITTMAIVMIPRIIIDDLMGKSFIILPL